MSKFTHDDVLDGALDIIINNATLLTLCSQQPTTRTEAITTYKLADIAIDSGDFTKANGDTSGRKATVGAQNAVAIDSSGTSNHVAIVDGTRLLHVTTHTGQALVSGGTVNIGAFDIEFLDVTP